MSLSATHTALAAADVIVAKAVRAREVARIARSETLLRRYITAEWDRLARQAAEAAERIVRSGSGDLKIGDHRAVMRAVDERMRQWGRRVRLRFLDDVEDAYKLARIAGWKKGTGQVTGSLQYNTKPFSAKPGGQETKLAVVEKQDEFALLPTFEARDDRAIDQLRRNQTFWIGRHYEANVREAIGEVTREEMLERGRSRAQAGARMESVVRNQLALVSIPKGWSGTAKQYFEGLVANAMTTARVQGQLRSFDSLQIKRYEIVNPSDERTCPVCSHMDGKTFSVTVGLSQMEAELAAENPESVREAHPWIRTEELKSISPKAGAAGADDEDALAKAGFALPTYHFRCRCTIDVSVS